MYPIFFLAAGLAALVLLSSPSMQSGSPEARDDDDATYEPPSDPAEVASAIIDEFLSQSDPRGRDRLGKLLRERLAMQVSDSGWQVLFPVDLEGTFSYDRLSSIVKAIGEAHSVPISVRRAMVKDKFPFAVVLIGDLTAIPDFSWLEYDDEYQGVHQTRFGGVLDLIMNTVISASVGTAVSMGTEGFIHSMGGERRLARIQRQYAKAEARGDQATMDQIRNKMKKSATKIKGKQVDWSKVEEVTGIPMN